MKLPLKGVRVVDLTVIWAGPYATELLGDLGAEVVRIESLHHFQTNTRGFLCRPTREQVEMMGQYGRVYPELDPGERPWDRFAIFNAHGRNKLSASLDISKPRGKEIFLRLIARSDIFIENNAARVKRDMGITYDVLKEVNPRLIMLSMPGLGNDGPYVDYQGFGSNVDALSGMASLRGYRDADPSTLTGIFYMDAASGPAAAFALMAALRLRERTGRGQYIDMSQAENMLGHVGPAILDYTLNGRVRGPMGNRDDHAVQGVYPCRGEDRWLALTIATDAEWQAFCAVAGRPELAADPRFRDGPSRYRHHDDLDEAISAWTRDQDNLAAMEALQAARVPAGALLDEPAALADPQLAARGFFHWVDHPQAGRHRYPGHLWQFAATEMPFRRAPCLGEHNEYVYKEILGYSDAEYEELIALGQVGDAYVPEVM
jgi:crotonobetainyl-CoA:carnitine CoA-transferase CaiB-like acyl-CoA transferase